MKKKISKKKKPAKQKIDVVIESLVHLEQKVKELIEKISSLEKQKSYPYYPPQAPMPTHPQPKYWPNDFYRYDGVTWTY